MVWFLVALSKFLDALGLCATVAVGAGQKHSVSISVVMVLNADMVRSISLFPGWKGI